MIQEIEGNAWWGSMTAESGDVCHEGVLERKRVVLVQGASQWDYPKPWKIWDDTTRLWRDITQTEAEDRLRAQQERPILMTWVDKKKYFMYRGRAYVADPSLEEGICSEGKRAERAMIHH